MSTQNIIFQIKSITYQHSFIMRINWTPAEAYNHYSFNNFYLNFILYALKG
jgi:hypothetical protein